MMELKFPRPLPDGATLGVAAPAGPFDRERFERGVRVLEEMGFDIFIPEGLFREAGYLAGPDAHRAETLERLFADPGVDAVI